MDAMLQCGHQSEVTLGVSFGWCSYCRIQVKVAAIECRVWHAYCMETGCNFRVNCNQEQYSALRQAQLHRLRTSHSCVYDYIVPDVWKAKIRDAYGRSVKPFIVDDRWFRYPEARSRPVETIELPSGEEEVPPF